MAGINEFMIFDENNQNSMTNEIYSTDEQRLNGVASGIARSSLYNKALSQNQEFLEDCLIEVGQVIYA